MVEQVLIRLLELSFCWRVELLGSGMESAVGGSSSPTFSDISLDDNFVTRFFLVRFEQRRSFIT